MTILPTDPRARPLGEFDGRCRARAFTRPIATSFDYVEPGGDSDLPVMRVNVLVTPIHTQDGDIIGGAAIGYAGLRPGLVSLLARGDEAMY